MEFSVDLLLPQSLAFLPEFSSKIESPPPLLPPITIQVESPPPSASPTSLPAAPANNDPVPAPALPRSPAVVEFVNRFDRDGQNLLEQLKKELAPHASQLVVLYGVGGVGKTTLAIEATWNMLDAFARRVIWASADGLPEFGFSSLLDEVASQLGRPNLRQLALTPKEEQVRALAAAPSLIVLDNFETIAPAEQDRCAEWLLRKTVCPALITSRQRIDGARNVPVGPLSGAEAHELAKIASLPLGNLQ